MQPAVGWNGNFGLLHPWTTGSWSCPRCRVSRGSDTYPGHISGTFPFCSISHIAPFNTLEFMQLPASPTFLGTLTLCFPHRKFQDPKMKCFDFCTFRVWKQMGIFTPLDPMVAIVWGAEKKGWGGEIQGWGKEGGRWCWTVQDLGGADDRWWRPHSAVPSGW
jgi:hypothetical protein